MMKARNRNERSGSAMVFVMVLLSAMAVLSVSLLHTTKATVSERKGADRDLGSVYVAEAALSEALMDIASGGTGNLGSADNPIDYGGAGFFVVAQDGGDGTFTLTATGAENNAESSVEVVVRRSGEAFYRWAAFGDDSMTMDSNAMTDSYNSSLGAYGSQDINGSGSTRYALQGGDIGSNEDIRMASNTQVWGDATPGPNGVVGLTGKASISGDTTPATERLELPPLDIPVIASSGDKTISSSTTWSSGNYAFDNLTIDGTERLVIEGPATVLVTNFELRSNSELIIDSTNGSVEVFVLDDFVMNSNTLISAKTSDPADFQLYLNSDNIIDPNSNVDLALVEFDSNAQLFGTIYAPNAHIDIDSNFELFGSVVARSVHLDSNSKVHFDENLLNVTGADSSNFDILCWRFVAAP